MPDIFQEPQKQQHPMNDAARSVQEIMEKKANSMGLFAAYCLRPTGVSFASQESDEVIILFLRQHFITNAPWILAALGAATVPPLLYWLSQLTPLFPFSLPRNILLVGTGFYYLMILSYAFSKFVSWFYNIGVVTQKRIVDLDTTNILAQDTATANFNEIVDVKYTQRGFFQSFFNYGDVVIQTEAIHENFDFLVVPNPTQVVDIISDLRVVEGAQHGES